MKLKVRFAAAWLVAGILACSMAARADVLKQLPADAWVVFKIKNPQEISQKLAAISEKMGLIKLEPRLGNGVDWLLSEMKVKQGVDTKSEFALAIYPPPGEHGDPDFVAAVPVTDYRAFLGNMKDVKAEGNVNSFRLPEGMFLFSAQYDNYALIGLRKESVAKRPAGMEVRGVCRKQLDSNDITVYANLQAVFKGVRPIFEKSKADLLKEAEQGLKAEKSFDQKYTPVIMSLLKQLMVLGDGAMNSAQGATYGVNLSNDGIHSAVMVDFDPNSPVGKTIAQIKNSDGDLVVGLPPGKYLAFGGMVQDPKLLPGIFDQLLGPVPAELAKVGPDAKPFLNLISALRMSLSSAEGASFGYPAPQGRAGRANVMQQVTVYRGEAKKMAEAQRQTLSSINDMMRFLPQEARDIVKFDVKRDAKNVDGVSLDEFSMKFKFDENTPDGAQMAQVFAMFYGGAGVSGYMGAVDDRSYIVVTGSAQAAEATVAAARRQDASVGQAAQVKAVAAKLPQRRAIVYYVAVDNVVNTIVQYANEFGAGLKIKFPTDQPPVGIALGTEGSAVRIDSYISNDLIENIIAAAIEAFYGANDGQGGGDL